ncbi:methionyl-tRNA formyltransferase [Candidatus Mesenet endosymbiont of Phosphuga atrata]|uniref:methionyl-tRNA formyltransferase n=1 Tax=Candidatus Mesenet endosymbiont of Phosphuga atrata TaxID=3066221 RepID=UPI0030CE5DA3
MRIVFMGSPNFAITPLLSLIEAKYNIVAVYTKSPKSAGRGQKITKTPVHTIADQNNINVCIPSSFKTSDEIEIFRNLHSDIAIVVAYGLILPKLLFNIPKYGCINIHPSLLPRWRGAAPIQYAILTGDKETGVTIMQVDEHLDAGPIFMQRSININTIDNYQTLHNKLSILGSELLLQVLSNINKLIPKKQCTNGVSYANKIEDYKIYLYDSAEVACRKIKALYPKAFFYLGDKRVKILDASYYEDDNKQDIKPGTIINCNMHIKLSGNSILVPKILQIEGKKACTVDDFTRGHSIQEMEIL